MKINDDHMYHGAAITQIAEHEQFTEINSFKIRKDKSRSSFLVNDNVGIYLKYASNPKKPFDEYLFTFTNEHLCEIDALSVKVDKVFVVMICVKAKEVCCIKREELRDLVQRRKLKRGQEEESYGVLVTAKKGKSFRVYVNDPGKKKTILGEEQVVSRNRFPDAVFNE